MYPGRDPLKPFGAFITDATGLRLSVEEKALFADTNPFGFIIFARNVDTPDQLRALCDDFREAVGREALITVDQEGGRVQRLRSPHWREWSDALDFVEQAGEHAEEAMYLRGRIIAHELRAVGLDSNCAPNLDVLADETHPFLISRCYGDDPARVATLGRAYANGMLAGGVVPIMKHMPGHGRTTHDTHFDLPRVAADRGTLDTVDFAPFMALNDLPMGMTGHLIFEAIDETPATLSHSVIEVIRCDIGFDGLLVTDDISMKALSGPPALDAAAALAAGCDVALLCNASLADRAATARAAGEMNTASQARALRALEARKIPDVVDISALDAQLAALLGGDLHG
jgi:beta-N-acetylhexosaminidase